MYELIDSKPAVIESKVYWSRQGVLFSKDTSAFRGDEKDTPDEVFAIGEVAVEFQHKTNVIPISIFVNCEDTPSHRLIAYSQSVMHGEGLTLVIDTGSNFTHWPKGSYTAFLELPPSNTEKEKILGAVQVIEGLDDAFLNQGIWCMDYSDIAPIFSKSAYIQIELIDVDLSDPAKFSINVMESNGGVSLVVGTSPLNSPGEFEEVGELLKSGFGDHHFIFSQYHDPGQTNYRLVCFCKEKQGAGSE